MDEAKGADALHDEGGSEGFDAEFWATLSAHRLPMLSGRSFLEVGCRNPPFCAFAVWAGATRAVGLDEDQELVERIAATVPAAAFQRGTLADLPDGPFDVILVTSMLETAADPRVVIEGLVERLSARGVLSIEVPVLSAVSGKEFVSVGNPDDDEELVWRPQAEAMRRFCSERGFTFRLVGRSAAPAVGLTQRFVYHIGKPKRDAWLLMGPSTSGKTTKARQLAQIPGTVHVPGDLVLNTLLSDPESGPPLLLACLEEATPSTLNVAYEAIAEHGAEAELAEVMVRDLQATDIPILDLSLPPAGRARFELAVERLGFHPIVLVWRHPIEAVDAMEHLRHLARFVDHARTEWGDDRVDPGWAARVLDDVARQDSMRSRDAASAVERDRAAVERDEAVAAHHRAVVERDEAVAAHHRAVAARDRAVVERDEAVAKREEESRTHERTLLERDEALADLKRAEYARDRAEAERAQLQGERDRSVAEAARLAEERDRLRVERDEVAARCRRESALRAEGAAVISAMQRSRSWRYTAWLRRK